MAPVATDASRKNCRMIFFKCTPAVGTNAALNCRASARPAGGSRLILTRLAASSKVRTWLGRGSCQEIGCHRAGRPSRANLPRRARGISPRGRQRCRRTSASIPTRSEACLPNAIAFGQHRPNVRRNELVNFSKLGEQFFNEIEECALISQRALTDVGGG
jgi:hypothetical protein